MDFLFELKIAKLLFINLLIYSPKMKQVFLSYHDIHADCIELAKIIKKIQTRKINFNFKRWPNTRFNYCKLSWDSRY